MGWEGSKKSFPTVSDSVCVCQSWAGAAGYNPGLDSFPGEEEAPTLESHQGRIRTQSLAQNQFFPTSISPLVSNTPSSLPARRSQLQRLHAAGELRLPKNPTRSLPSSTDSGR